MIKEISKYIENNTGFVIGTDLFTGHRPANAQNECVVILEGAGGKPEFSIPDSVEKAIQILTRAKSYFTARADSYTIYNLLHGKSGITLPVVTSGEEYLVNVIEAMNVPQPIGQDAKGLWEFSTNFIFRIQNK